MRNTPNTANCFPFGVYSSSLYVRIYHFFATTTTATIRMKKWEEKNKTKNKENGFDQKFIMQNCHKIIVHKFCMRIFSFHLSIFLIQFYSFILLDIFVYTHTFHASCYGRPFATCVLHIAYNFVKKHLSASSLGVCVCVGAFLYSFFFLHHLG